MAIVAWIMSIFTSIFNVIMAPFKSMHPVVGLLVISILTGIVMLLIFGKTSNQKAIRKAKGLLKAYIAEIWLFRDDLLQMLSAIIRVLGNTGRYFLHSLRPLIFILIPVLIIMINLGIRYEKRPFKPGEEATVTVTLSDLAWTKSDAIVLSGSEGVEVITPPLRIPQLGEIEWRIRVASPGEHELKIQTPAGTETKRITVDESGDRLTPMAPARGHAFSEAYLLYPVEPPLPGQSGIRKIEVKGWPSRDLAVFGFGIHWLVFFFVISLIAGFAVKGAFGVEV